MGFINKMDRDGACLETASKTLRDKLHAVPVNIQSAVVEDNKFVGVVDIIDLKRHTWDDEACEDGSEFTTTALSPSTDEHAYLQAIDSRTALVEQLADLDDTFAEVVLADTFDAETVDTSEIKRVLRRLTIERAIVPVLCGTARRNKGIQPLMDAVLNYLPSPLERAAVDLLVPPKAKAKAPAVLSLPADPKGPLCALAFKVTFDSFRGHMVFLRVYSGTLNAAAVVSNSRSTTKERINKLLIVHADHHKEVKQVAAGSIVAAVGMKHTRTGDTIVLQSDTKTRGARLDGVDIPSPVFTCTIEAESSEDEDAFELALESIQIEDPSVVVTIDGDTGQKLISGMGELHLDIIISRLKTQYKLDCRTGAMQVAYRERPTAPVECSHSITRMIAGREQTMGLTLALTCRPGQGALVVDFDASGLVPDDYEHEEAIREGVQAACMRGVVQGYPIVDVGVAVLGTVKEADTSPSAAAMCALEGTRRLLADAAVAMLQPMMKLEIVVSVRSLPACSRGHQPAPPQKKNRERGTCLGNLCCCRRHPRL